MTTSRSVRRFGRFSRKSILGLAVLSAVAAFASLVPQAQANLIYWDTNGTTAGAGSTPTGTWGTSNFWNTDATGGNGGAFQTATANSDDLYIVAGPSASSGNLGWTLTVSGSQVAKSLNFTHSGNVTISGGTLITLGDGTAGTGGINVAQYAYGTTSNGQVTISTAVTLNNSQTWTNNSVNSLIKNTGVLNLQGFTLTLSGSGNITTSSVISGTGAIIKNGSGTYTTANAVAYNYSGGFTLNAGTAFYDDNSVVSGVITQGPFGTGTLTLNGGTLNQGNTSRTIHNSLVLGGTVNIISSINPGSNTTFNPTTTTTAGTITVNGAVTVYANNAPLTFTGPITGINTPSLTIRGYNSGTGANLGSVTLTNASTNSTFGNVNVGETIATGSAGGSLTISTLSAMGTVASTNYTVDFGGTLNTSASAVASHAFNTTINNGGIVDLRGQPTGVWIVNSGATLRGNGAGGTSLASTSSLTVPTAGVLNIGVANVTLKTSYPALTGTISFGGSGGGTLAPGAGTSTLSSAAGSDRTIAFNGVGGSQFSFSTLSLNASLTVAGSGVTSLVGLRPQTGGDATPGNGAVAGSLGTVTQTGTQSIYVNMAPTAAVLVKETTSGWSGGTTINSGTLAAQLGAANNTQLRFGTGGVTLNGGTLRIIMFNGNTPTVTDAIAVGTNGGTLETWYSNTTNASVSFAGAITGSGPLTLSYGGNTAGNNFLLLAPTSASSYNGPINVTTTSARGRVQFNANSLAGLTGLNKVTVAGGAVFGVDALATLTGNISKFTLGTGSILSLENLASSNIDLSGSGLNSDIRIGSTTAITYSGTLTPFGSSYNFTPTMGATLTLGTANQLTGTKNLDVRAGAVSSGAVAVASGTLAITAAQNYTGSTYVGGTVLNALMGGGVTGTALTTSASLSGTTAITVDNSSTFTVSGGTTGAANVAITVKGASTLTAQTTASLTNSGTLTLGGDTGGGTMNITSGQTPSLTSLTVGAGANTLNASSAGTLALTGTGATVYSRLVGGYLQVSGGTINFTNAPSNTTSVIGGILVGATFGNTPIDFVAANSGTLAAPVYTAQSTASSWGAGQNITNTNSTSGFTGTTVSTLSINSLRNFGNATGTVAIGTGTSDTLTLASGMLLSQASVGLTLNGPGQLLVGSDVPDYHFINSSAAAITVAARLGSAKPLTKSGAGNLTLSNTNNAITDIYANAGAITVSTGAGSLGTSGTISFFGGTLIANNLGTSTFSRNVIVGPQGGTIRADTALSVLNWQTGTITLNGNLNINAQTGGGSSGRGTYNISSAISGEGTISFNGGDNGGSGRSWLTLSGNNSAFSGGIRLTGGGNQTIVRLDHANAAGSGAIVNLNGKGDAVYFLNNMANVTLANDFVNVPVLVNLTASSNPVTLSGKLITTSGLMFQGWAASGVANETVLAGTVSASGTAAATNGLYYNYSSTPTTSVQQFVNAPAGISVGSTGRQGTTLLTTSDQGTNRGWMYIDTPTSTQASASNITGGALGYLRFNGVNSFIPGAAGPGYLAALHQASDTTNYGNGAQAAAAVGSTGGANELFGFGLTGTSGAGTTYALPEGKSFVIGSLGTSANGQTGGRLYAASTGSSNNLAILTGSNKLSGFAAGDVNIHANAAADTQTLAIGANAANDTFQIGTTGQAVVFTPTYGDSGVTGAVTLMANRTGLTTINKVGAGVVEFKNAKFMKIDGTTSIRNLFNINVNAGTLTYSQTDTGSDLYNSFNVNSGATLKGTGTIKGNVVITSGGVWAPGNSIGIQNANSATYNSGSRYEWEAVGYDAQLAEGAAGTTHDQINITGTSGTTVNISGGTLRLLFDNNLNFGGSFWDTNRQWTIINNTAGGTATGTFSTANIEVYKNGSSFDDYNITGEGSFATAISGNSLVLNWLSAAGSPAFDIGPSSLALKTLKGANSISDNLTLTNNGTVTGNTTVTSLSGPLSNTPTSFTGITVGGTANTVVSLATGGYALSSQNVTVLTNAGTTNTVSTVNYNVGEATAAIGSFNTANTLSGVSGGSALSSRTSRNFVGPADTTDILGTTGVVELVDSSETLTMNWRTRTAGEIPGGGTAPLFSDVVQITTTDSNVYVLKMYYVASDLTGPESALFLGELLGTWQNAGNDSFAKQGAWVSQNTLGQWGIDTTDVTLDGNLYGGYVWAVVNGNGTFAVIPEPTSLALLGLGAVGLLARRRRK